MQSRKLSEQNELPNYLTP